MPLILASTSPFRRQLLTSAGLSFACVRPEVEECLTQGRSAEEVAIDLALRKALAVAAHNPDAVIIGADQVADLHGTLLGKPASAAMAHAQIGMLSGQTHRLVTGVAVVGAAASDSDRTTRVFSDITHLTFRRLESQEIDVYVATGEWEGCAGGYRIEGQGINLVSSLEGDYFNILGLPLLPLLNVLRLLGISPLWK